MVGFGRGAPICTVSPVHPGRPGTLSDAFWPLWARTENERVRG